MKQFMLILAVLYIGLATESAVAALPTNVTVSPATRDYLDHRVSKCCRGRIVEVSQYGLGSAAPKPPTDPPFLYWRIKIRIEDQYKGWRWPWSKYMTLTTLATPLVVQPGELVLAYGTKTKSDRGRLWGNVFPLTALPDGYIVDKRTNDTDIFIVE